MASEYDVLGDTLKRQAERQKEAASRKLNQQFTGRLGSGAAAKIASKALTDIDVGLQDELAKLQYEKAAKDREERLIKEGQSFQTAERLGTQEFASSEAQKGREFQTGEREAGQQFAGSEAEKLRAFQSGERLGAEAFAGSEAEKQRSFATGEREAGQAFASGEAGKQRQFQTGERLGQQAFAADEAARQRGFAREERLGTQDFQGYQSSLDRSLQQMNINLGYEQLLDQQRQFAAEFEENVRTNLFNKIVSLKEIDTSTFNNLLQFLQPGTDPLALRSYLGARTQIPTPNLQTPGFPQAVA